jgi:hypothetical protein
MSFRRAGTALLILALAGLGGCWWHDSAVPAIGADDRPRRSPLRDGVYCTLEADAQGPMLEEDCARLTWDRGDRRLQASEVSADGATGGTLLLDVAPLTRGLAVLQNAEETDEGVRYELYAIVPTRRGYVIVPLPEPAVRDAIAAEEGATVAATEDPKDYGMLLSGSPDAVRRVVERSAIAWIGAQNPADEGSLSPYDPNAADDEIQPIYSVRRESLDEEIDTAGLEEAVSDLRDALKRVVGR